MLTVDHHSDIRKFILGDHMSADHKSFTRKSLSLLLYFDSLRLINFVKHLVHCLSLQTVTTDRKKLILNVSTKDECKFIDLAMLFPIYIVQYAVDIKPRGNE